MKRLIWLCLALLCLLPACERDEISEVAVTPPTQVVEDITTDIPVQVSQTRHVYWAGVSYILQNGDIGDIRPGVPLSVVRFDSLISPGKAAILPDDFDPFLTRSNVIPVGNTIYSCEGHSAAWRVCGYDERGVLRVFAMSDAPRLTGQAAAFYFPADEQISAIILRDGSGNPIGEISGRADIAALLEPLRAEGKFIDRETLTAAANAANGYLRLELIFTDNSSHQLGLYADGVASWFEPLSLPTSVYETAREYIVYDSRGGFYQDRGFNYGNTVADNIGLSGEYSQDRDNMEAHLDGTRLYLRSTNGRSPAFLLTDDAAGDIRIEGIDIFYRRTDGKVARIRFDCPGLTAMAKKAARGEDMSDCITAYEIVDEAANRRFQLRDGVRFTLRENGELARNGEVIAVDVRDFCLDASGVVYATAEGAFRRLYADGTTVQLCRGEVTHVTTSGLYVYCATAAGEIERVRCDGEWVEPIAQMAAADLEYTPLYLGSDAVTVLTPSGEVWVLANGMRYLVAEEVAAIDACGEYDLTLIFEGGHTERQQLLCPDGRNLCWGWYNRLRGTALIR